MPAEERRKIMKHGTSGVIAIPKPYLRYQKLSHGDVVKVLYNSFLLIIPKAMEPILEQKRQLIDQLLRQ